MLIQTASRARVPSLALSLILALGVILIAVSRDSLAASPYDEAPVVSPDSVAGDNFGSGVAIDGETLVVGAQWATVDGREKAGTAHVFARSAGGQWTQIARLVASDGQPFDQFGAAVALDDDLIAVGATLADINGSTNQGAVYLFERDAGGPNAWGEVKKLTIPGGGNFDNVGDALAVQGDEVFVGAKDSDAGGSNRRGGVYVYRRGDGWAQPQVLTDPSSRESDSFGAAIAVDGEWLLIGSERADVTGNFENDGAALLFRRTAPGAPWTFVKRLVASDADGSERFGAAVALRDGRALVGAPAATRNGLFGVGKAHLFERNSGGADNWGEVAKLLAGDGLAFDNFGVSVALGPDAALVGANGAGINPADSGAVYRYEPSGSGWAAVGQVRAGDAATGAGFAGVMAHDGQTLLVGAPEAAQGKGRAYAYSPGAPSQPSVTHLPLIFNPGFTILGELVNGGVVINPEGVRLGAVEGAIDGALPVGISRTTAPPEPLGPPVTPRGNYYRLNAAREMVQPMDKAFILALPIPAGVPTEHLAIAALGSTAGLLDTDDDNSLYWHLTPGVVDERNDLLLAAWPYLSPEGETVVLVEHPDMVSPAQGRAVRAVAGEVATSGNFVTACAPNLSCKDATLEAYANELQKHYADLFFNFSYSPPRLARQGVDLSVDPPKVTSSTGLYFGYIFDRTGPGCVNSKGDPAYGGQYNPNNGNLHICLAPNADLTESMREVIRHEVFHAFQHGYQAVMDDTNARIEEEWIIEGSATAVIKSGQNWERLTSPIFPLRPVDKSLLLVEEGNVWQYQAQDFWVYFGRTKSSSSIDWFKRLFARGATQDDVAASMNFGEAYWEWVRNQVIDHNYRFGDLLGPECVLEDQVIASKIEFQVSTNLNLDYLKGTTDMLNSSVVELDFQPDWYGLPATIAVQMLPEGTPQPDWFHWKVYRLPYPNCASFPSNVPQEYDEISPNLRYFVVLGNSENIRPQEWRITLE